MAESIGRFKRITAEEAHKRFKSTPKENPFRDELTNLFTTMEPLEHYELTLKPKEKGVVLRERIMRFAQDNDLDGVHVRAGKKNGKNIIIVWRELRQQARQEPSVQDPPADISPGAEEGNETNQPGETGDRAAALATGGPRGENLEPPPPEAGQSIMASDTTPEENTEG